MALERLVIDGERNSEIIDQHVVRYEFARAFIRSKAVLDVACGSGYGTRMLKEGGARNVLGVDISPQAIEYATAHFSNQEIKFANGPAERLSPLGLFDVVVSFETIEHLQEPETFLAEVTKVLVPDGTLIISTPAREYGTLEDRPRNPFHVREWSKDEFERLLSRYFQSIRIYGQYDFRRWFPYSRRLKRLLFKTFLPGYFEKLKRYPVLTDPPNYFRFGFEMIYMVCVCSQVVNGRSGAADKET